MLRRDEPSPWKVVRSRIVIDTPHLRLRSDDVELPDGTLVKDYFVRESRGFAVIFALGADGRVILVEQYKYGANRRLLELPAGAIDPGESARDAAVRELEEETGYVAGPPGLQSIGTLLNEPTNSTAWFEVFLARDARATGKQRLEVTESIEVRLATIDEVRRYVRDGTICVAPQVAAIYAVLDFLGRLT